MALAWLASAVLAGVALIQYPGAPRHASARARTLVDALIVGGRVADRLAGGAGGSVRIWRGGPADRGAGARLHHRRRGRDRDADPREAVSRPALRWAASGLAAIALASSALAWLEMGGTEGAGQALYAGWLVGWIGVALGTRLAAAWIEKRDELEPGVPGHPSVLIPSIPFAASVIAVAASAIDGGLNDFEIWCLSIVLILIVARQILALNKNIAFWRRLETKLEARDAAVRRSEARFRSLVSELVRHDHRRRTVTARSPFRVARSARSSATSPATSSASLPARPDSPAGRPEADQPRARAARSPGATGSSNVRSATAMDTGAMWKRSRAPNRGTGRCRVRDQTPETSPSARRGGSHLQGLSRSADRSRQPGAFRGPARARAQPPGATRQRSGCDLPRPRRFQGRERQPRPRDRRRAAGRGGGQAARLRTRRGHGRSPRWRRVRDPRRGHQQHRERDRERRSVHSKLRPRSRSPATRSSSAAASAIALTPFGGETAEELLRNADIAMYTAKASGKGTHQVFEQHARRPDGPPRTGRDLQRRWNATRAGVPAHRRHRQRPCPRGRGFAPMEAPRARLAPPSRFIGLGESTERSVRSAGGPGDGLSAGRAGGPGCRRELLPRRQPLPSPVSRSGPDRPGRRSASAVRPAGRTAGAGDHRECPRRAPLRRDQPSRAQGPRPEAGRGRLRHRPLGSSLPPSIADRHPQDRPRVHRRHDRGRAHGRRGRGDHPDVPQGAGSRRSPRAWSDPSRRGRWRR